ncbi:hypothetical protein CMV_015908 [Castanea mollissima]|uniref:Leucine-rich repeat-containing N-terminal plant-type domain-containing protein n=1 Tax=Castanea mollissima TaxID=60419 RepID=A0A8J4R4K1_9ROSI|nr:hypothetical protein CMV_015908 [Castanea mollissima]
MASLFHLNLEWSTWIFSTICSIGYLGGFLEFWGSLSQKPVTSPEEVKALQAIKSSLIDPNGNLSDWDQEDPCTSTWTGVFCNNTPSDDGYLHVERLYDLTFTDFYFYQKALLT